MRVTIPVLPGRNCGLGNALFPWAKAWIAADELGGSALSPNWLMSNRSYGHLFAKPRVRDAARMVAAAVLPRVSFTQSDYLATGERGYRAALRGFAASSGLDAREGYLLKCDGMWGGFYGIAESRDFVMHLLLGARGTASNMAAVRRRLDPTRLTVAVHMRGGDFLESTTDTDFAGRFNVRIPLEWYESVCDALASSLGARVQFLVVGDPGNSDVEKLAARLGAVTTADMRHADCSDLLACSAADLLVCSVSSYSMWAAFLSDRPYIWFRPNLTESQGYLTLWGHESAQQGLEPGSTAFNINALDHAPPGPHPDAGHAVRGVPIGWDGRIPDRLVQRLDVRLREKSVMTDLVMYGAVADAALRHGSDSGRGMGTSTEIAS